MLAKILQSKHPRLAVLSSGALRVLGSLLDASSATGHEFGEMSEARAALGMDSQTFAGYVSALKKHNAFDTLSEMTMGHVGQASVFQFVLAPWVLDDEKEIRKLVTLSDIDKPCLYDREDKTTFSRVYLSLCDVLPCLRASEVRVLSVVHGIAKAETRAPRKQVWEVNLKTWEAKVRR